jgi:Tol biopolymer transport system component
MLVGFVAAIVLTGGSAYADFTFGTPTNLGPTINSPHLDAPGSFSSDGLEMYFNSNRSGGYGEVDIWVTTRPTKDDDWGTPVNIGPTVNSSSLDGFPHISTDGLSLFFESKRPGGEGGGDIWVAKRETRNDAWGMPVNLGTPVNTSGSDSAPRLSTNGLELYYGSSRSGGYGYHDIWVSRRATKNDPWVPPVNLVNSSADEFFPFVSADGLALFFSENRGSGLRPGGFGNVDMWITTRASVSESWGTPVNLGPIVNSPSLECGPVISPDGFMLYFTSERPGGLGGPYGDIYQAPIVPIVDLNGDGIVDSADMCAIVDHWGTGDPLCDIGPMPWGDGIVDVQDLVVLAEHLFEEVYDPTLIAHWKLDETEGSIAYDSAAVNDGILNGGPLWQPTGGQIDGALAFDGTDD